jgi:uncharacterized protein (DUF2267 family)
LEAFDRAVQTTNLWLNEIGQELGQDQRSACHTLNAVLHALRERLEPDLAADFGTHLPMLVRGAYHDGFKLSGHSETDRSSDEFLERIKTELNVVSERDSIEAVRVVCDVVARHIDKRGAEEMWRTLPQQIRTPSASGSTSSTGSRENFSAPIETARPVNPREAARRADDEWRKIVEEGMYGEPPTKLDKPAGPGSGAKKARPH